MGFWGEDMQKKVETKEMAKKNEIGDTFFTVGWVIFILWQIVIMFGFWGGNPEGCFKKIDNLRDGLQLQINNLAQVQINNLAQELKEHRHTGIYGVPR